MVLWNEVSISRRFRNIGTKAHRCQDLDLSGSHDDIGHVTILFPGDISYRCSIVISRYL